MIPRGGPGNRFTGTGAHGVAIVMNKSSSKVKSRDEPLADVEIQTERCILVKLNANEQEIKKLLQQNGVVFEDFIIRSIPEI